MRPRLSARRPRALRGHVAAAAAAAAAALVGAALLISKKSSVRIWSITSVPKASRGNGGATSCRTSGGPATACWAAAGT